MCLQTKFYIVTFNFNVISVMNNIHLEEEHFLKSRCWHLEVHRPKQGTTPTPQHTAARTVSDDADLKRSPVSVVALCPSVAPWFSPCTHIYSYTLIEDIGPTEILCWQQSLLYQRNLGIKQGKTVKLTENVRSAKGFFF